MASPFLARASRLFFKPLPQAITNVTGLTQQMPKPGPATLQQPCPVICLPDGVKYIDKATNLLYPRLVKLEDKQASDSQFTKDNIDAFPLIHYSLNDEIERPVIHNEADVAREAQHGLVNWVTVVLKALTGLKIRVASEHLKFGSAPDLVWFYVKQGDSAEDFKNWKPFALLEYKDTKMISVDSFRNALYISQKDNDGLSEAEYFSLGRDLQSQTYIKGNNAVYLSKQAARYAQITQLPYVVAFDWNTMVTFDFSQDKYSKPKEPPLSMKVSWLQEGAGGGTGEQTYRSMLLGYLYHALEQTTGNAGSNLKISEP